MNRLEKTREDRGDPNFEELRNQRDAVVRQEGKERARHERQRNLEVEREREREREAKSYDSIMKEENMRSNKELAAGRSYKNVEEDFM